uniref:Uncharacterized protein n=1 Tax=Pyxicephalus adspersus TaxID=30357 RepID=A0AAV3APY8_PYXAD|nr:TPA: hypothetical protein GDO54_009451 [Pyxicephalus adspersus]
MIYCATEGLFRTPLCSIHKCNPTLLLCLVRHSTLHYGAIYFQWSSYIVKGSALRAQHNAHGVCCKNISTQDTCSIICAIKCTDIPFKINLL